MRIYYRKLYDEEWTEITDLYWFEENYVHDFGGDGLYHFYEFKFELDGKTIWQSEVKR